ncbi:hypothetical protein FSP39_008324 [Pinctada imbricata]|uniref:Mediator of RNA polymerase II transcription subunit 30 n=1 Tax=Pinctada imbricata TaxID=66713 RepID=A0AA88XNK7_PINIB|nr:hypothetical protein FSP39_008324 [Pinctada imbricata]
MAAPGGQFNPNIMSQQSPGQPYSTSGMMSASQQGMMSGSQPGLNVQGQQGMMGVNQQTMGTGQHGMMGGSQHGMMGGSHGNIQSGQQQSMMVGSQQGIMGSQQSMSSNTQQSMLGSQTTMSGSSQQGVMGAHQQSMLGTGGQVTVTGSGQQSMSGSSQQGIMGTHQQGMMGSAQQAQISGQLGTTMHQSAQLISPTKEINTITMCKKGQECVQDIVAKVMEIFKYLQTKSNPLPNGVNIHSNVLQERRNKLNEQLEQLSILFKKLRIFYDKVNEVCPEEPSEETVIPYIGQPLTDSPPHSVDHYKCRIVMEEKRELAEQLVMKNRQLKAIIDKMRTIVWEINTMLVMRKT